MKIFKIIIPLLALALSLDSCKSVYEDMSDCSPEGSVTINFRYVVTGNSDVFKDNISNVEVALFDDSGVFVMHKTVSQSDLIYHQGVVLDLNPGTYQVVCWGNVTNIVNYPVLTGVNVCDAKITHMDKETELSGNGERLFFAPTIQNITNPDADIFWITVPPVGTVVKTMDFNAAHNLVEVFIKGVTEMPEVEITNMADTYNFSMQASNRLMRYVQTAQSTSQPEFVGAKYYVPQFNQDEPIMINLTTGNSYWQIDFKKFLVDNNITVTPTTHEHIQIQLEYSNGDFTATLPNWGNTGVEPEI